MCSLVLSWPLFLLLGVRAARPLLSYLTDRPRTPDALSPFSLQPLGNLESAREKVNDPSGGFSEIWRLKPPVGLVTTQFRRCRW